jgi:hypothetical protein
MHCFPEMTGKCLEHARFAQVSVLADIIHRRIGAQGRSRGGSGARKKFPDIKEQALPECVRMQDPKPFGLAVRGMARLPIRESSFALPGRYVSFI